MASRRSLGESGRGLIGFIVALVVVGLVAYSLREYYRVKSRADVRSAS